MRQVHHHAHVVLDHHDGHAPFLVQIDDVTRHVLFFFEVHAGHRFVEQDDFRLQGDGAGEFNALAQTVRERTGVLVANVLDFQEVDDFLDRASVLCFLSLGAAGPVQHAAREAGTHQVVPADHDVVQYRHTGE